MSSPTASIAPAQIAIPSKSRRSVSKLMSGPIFLLYLNVTPSRSTRRTCISIASRGSRKADTPTSIVPPANGRLSKTVTRYLLTASSRATAMPAGPAPTTATRSSRSVICGMTSGIPDASCRSTRNRSLARIASGRSMSPRRQARSQGAEQT
jgi:hypothetical protein